MKGLKAMLAAIIGAAAMQNAALGQAGNGNKGDQALAAILPPRVGERACFERIYDGVHLRQHPKQQVTAMTFALRYVQVPGIDVKRYDFGMAVKVRTRPETLYTSGFCETNVNGSFPAGNLCAVACDGGGVSIQKVRDADALYIYLQTPASGIRMGSSCNDVTSEQGFVLRPGADDMVFRLNKASSTACQPLERAVRLDAPG